MKEPHWFHAENPLTRHLRNWKSIEEISEALTYDPLHGLNISSLTLMERQEILIGEKTPLSPTTTSLQAAMAIVAMHRFSLRARNPLLAEGRRRVNEGIETARSGATHTNLPPAPGACLQVIKGITGTAKSVTVKHTLTRLIGPQVIEHGEEPAALFKSATQLSWLFTGMSHDGSRGGLLTGTLLAIDKLLGTTHAQDLPKMYRSVERLSGAVIALLHSYYLGVLVIDEIQLLNLIESHHSTLMHLFLLNLINSGIPVVLIGNPYGFAWLSAFSQNLSRSVERQQIVFHPCGAVGKAEDDEWENVFIGIRNFYLLDDKVIDIDVCSDLLKRLSGGFPRLALTLWCSAQLNVLNSGGTILTAEDLEDAYKSDEFADARPLCEGFAQRDPTLLMRWRDTDIPVDFYAAQWGKSIAAEATDADIEKPPSHPRPLPKGGSKNTPQKSAAKLQAAQTRERNKLKKRQSLIKSLSPGDMRLDGIKQHALASLDELMREIEAKKNQ